MDDVEHQLHNAGIAIKNQATALGGLVARTRERDAALADHLAAALEDVRAVGDRLISIASAWHGVER